MAFPDVSDVVRRRMRRIRKADTKPELFVRRLAHALGYRYRIHRKDLPGTPDLVFPGRKKVIFVHGCFWHQHEGYRLQSQPRSRHDYWVPKLKRNVERDAQNLAALAELGWEMLVIWECETKDRLALAARLASFLG